MTPVGEAKPDAGAEGKGFLLTRRRLLVAGAGGVALVASFGVWGRFALGDSFERHVADQLGLELGLTEALLDRLRSKRGDYEFRASGFLIATQGPTASLVPERVRREAIEAFVGPMFWDISDGKVMTLAYAGLRDSADYRPCRVLVP